MDYRDPGDDVRPEKKLGAVTSLLLIVDAHATNLEGGQKWPSVKEPSPITLLAAELEAALRWKPLTRRAKEERFGNEGAV